MEMALFTAPYLPIVARSLVYASITGVLIAISWIDWHTRRIPNSLVAALVGIRLFAFVLDMLGGQGLQAIADLGGSLVRAMGCALAILALKATVDKATHQDSLGLGDVKLAAAGCLFLTASQIFTALLIASLAGVVFAICFRVVRKDRTFPFGPALCLGIVLGFLI